MSRELDAAWNELLLDALASDGPIRDSDVKEAVARNRPRIEAALLADTPSVEPRETPCSRCGSDWHYTDEHVEDDLPPGAYLASALEAAHIPCDSGEDVDRLIAELRERGWALTRFLLPTQASDSPEKP